MWCWYYRLRQQQVLLSDSEMFDTRAFLPCFYCPCENKRDQGSSKETFPSPWIFGFFGSEPLVVIFNRNKSVKRTQICGGKTSHILLCWRQIQHLWISSSLHTAAAIVRGKSTLIRFLHVYKNLELRAALIHCNYPCIFTTWQIQEQKPHTSQFTSISSIRDQASSIKATKYPINWEKVDYVEKIYKRKNSHPKSFIKETYSTRMSPYLSEKLSNHLIFSFKSFSL